MTGRGVAGRPRPGRHRAVVLAAAVLIALLTDRTGPGYLDPAAPDELGSRAVAALLRDRGVTVDVVHTAAQAAGHGGRRPCLVAVPRPAGPGPAGRGPRVGRRRRPGRGGPRGARRARPRSRGHRGGRAGRGARARLRPARRRAGRGGPAGRHDLPRRPGPSSCYPSTAGAALLRVSDGGRTVTALGSADALLNRSLAEEGNAALALGLLGTHAPAGVVPARTRGALRSATSASFLDLRPAGMAGGARRSWSSPWCCWPRWRARRLGPVVAEPLPVVVRAAETVEGRARLYRRGGCPRPRRRGAARRHPGPPGAAARAAGRRRAAARSSPRSPPAPAGPPPTSTRCCTVRAPADDAALVALADDPRRPREQRCAGRDAAGPRPSRVRRSAATRAREALRRPARRGRQGRRRPGRRRHRPGHRAAVPRPRAARGRARRGQDAAGPGAGRGARRWTPSGCSSPPT